MFGTKTFLHNKAIGSREHCKTAHATIVPSPFRNCGTMGHIQRFCLLLSGKCTRILTTETLEKGLCKEGFIRREAQLSGRVPTTHEAWIQALALKIKEDFIKKPSRTLLCLIPGLVNVEIRILGIFKKTMNQ